MILEAVGNAAMKTNAEGTDIYVIRHMKATKKASV